MKIDGRLAQPGLFLLTEILVLANVIALLFVPAIGVDLLHSFSSVVPTVAVRSTS